MAFRPAYEIPERWESNVPIDLVPAVKHIHETFEEANTKLRWLTMYMCYALLHPKHVDKELFREYNSALTHVKGTLGPARTQMFVDLLKRETPSAIFKAFAYLYDETTVVQARAAFSMLLGIGTSNEERLGATAIDWASWHVKNMTLGVAFKSDFWVKQYCDKQDHNLNDDHDEMIYWMSWRAPRYLMMQPSLGMPFDASTALERVDEGTTREVLKRLHDDFVIRLDVSLKHFVGEAQMEAAINRPKPQPKSEGDITSSAVISRATQADPDIGGGSEMPIISRREASKLISQARNRSWQKEYLKLKKERPGLTDVRYSEILAGMKIAEGKSPETIRKHMRKMNV